MSRSNKITKVASARVQNKNLKPLAKGYDPRRNVAGRPRKFVSQMAKDFGYTHSQVIDTMKSLLAMTKKELTDIMTAKEATALEGAVARALIKAKDSGDLHKIEVVITRAFGAPKQVIEDVTPPEEGPQLTVDWSKLSDSALREIAAAQIKK